MFSRLKRLPWRVIAPWCLAVVFAAAAGLFFLQYNDLKTEDDRRDEVADVARDFITALTNFSHETVDEDIEEIHSYAVGDFAEEADTFLGEDGIAAITEAEAVSEGEIISLFVQAVDSDEASVFAVVRETISNALTQEPQSDILRLEVGMIKTSEGWKVNRVDVFQSPGTGLVPGDLGR